MSGGLTRGLMNGSVKKQVRSVYLPIRTNTCWDRPSLESFVFWVLSPIWGQRHVGQILVWRKQEEVLVMWIVLSPQSILLLLKTNIPTNWDEEQNKNTYRWSLDRSWVHCDTQLWRTKKNRWWSAESSWSTVSMFHMSIVKKSHSNELCEKSLWEGTLHAEGVYLTQKHESVAEVCWGHIHHLHPRWSTVISCNISCSKRRTVWSRRQNGDAASAVSRNSLETQGSLGISPRNGRFDLKKRGIRPRQELVSKKRDLVRTDDSKTRFPEKGNSSKKIR